MATTRSILIFALLVVICCCVEGTSVDPKETVCYGDLGCFTTSPPWTSNVRPIPALPEDPAVINTQFWLFTRSDPISGVLLSANNLQGLYNSSFDSAKKSVFLVHGWTHDSNHSWIKSSISELLTLEDINIICVDWAPGAGLPYLRAQANAQLVGSEISKFILFLVNYSVLKLSDVHLVGHDLGAHVAGYAGHRIYGIGRITGLDPATIYFEGGDVNTYLDASDAVYVDIIHTDAPHNKHVGLGFGAAVGHVDIFANNGREQVGCTDTIKDLVSSAEELVTFTGINGAIDPFVCSHVRAAEYFVESINSLCPFSAYTCSSWLNFQNGLCYSACRNAACTAMGYHAAKYPGRGVFYLDTQSFKPYCNAVIHIQLDVYQSQKSTRGIVDYILIGDVGQTKEALLYSGLMDGGFILTNLVTVPGSNPLRIGHVDSVRLRYKRNSILGESELIIQKVVVQQSNITIAAYDTIFNGAVLRNDEYVTVYPAN